MLRGGEHAIIIAYRRRRCQPFFAKKNEKREKGDTKPPPAYRL